MMPRPWKPLIVAALLLAGCAGPSRAPLPAGGPPQAEVGE
jgi:hypothetical protein